MHISIIYACVHYRMFGKYIHERKCERIFIINSSELIVVYNFSFSQDDDEQLMIDGADEIDGYIDEHIPVVTSQNDSHSSSEEQDEPVDGELLKELSISFSFRKQLGRKEEYELRRNFRIVRESARLVWSGHTIYECGSFGEGIRQPQYDVTNIRVWGQGEVLCTMYDSQRKGLSFVMEDVPAPEEELVVKLRLLHENLPTSHPVFALCDVQHTETGNAYFLLG